MCGAMLISMNVVTVGNIKKDFSDILKNVTAGAEYTISFGKKKEKLAVVIPYVKYRQKKKLGALANRGSYKMTKNFKMTDSQLLGS